ncbi:NAD(P)H-binding protein [Rhodobacteraceae bacterium MCCB 386]|nr:NAD(P)H-binding protein [Roseitranquillus sediminis]
MLGAGGKTGREAVRQALDSGHHVRAVEKGRAPDLPPHDRLTTTTADVLDDDLVPLMQGVDAVVSTLGLRLSPMTALGPPPLYTEGALRITQAMKSAGVQRLVVISASFAANRQQAPLWFQAAAMPSLMRIFDQMADMERVLRATEGVDWTAVRPGWLLDLPSTGDYTVAEDVIPRGMIRTRHGDLAHFMLRCATGGDWIRGTPAIARPEALRHSTPPALLAEIRGALGLS